MKFLMTYTMAKSFIASDALAEENLKRFKPGDTVSCEIKKVRNPKFHKKYMKMLSVAYGNIKEGLSYPNFDAFRADVACAAGFCDEKIGISGKPIRIAKSISYSNMDELEFEDLYNRSIDVILLHVLPVGTNKQDFENAVNEILGFC